MSKTAATFFNHSIFYETDNKTHPETIFALKKLQTPASPFATLCKNILSQCSSYMVFARPVEGVSRQRNFRESTLKQSAALHRPDELGLRLVAAQLTPDNGPGGAINNSHTKASGGRAK